MERNTFEKIQIWVIKIIAKISWRQTSYLKIADIDTIREMCTRDYHIIATRRQNYLATFFIALGNFLLTGKWGYYSHVLMNLENQVGQDSDFRFIEATGSGVHYSTFINVFDNVDSVALIVPSNITLAEWTKALDKARSYLGRPYDNLFDLKSDLEINCVELIRLALQETDDYYVNFAEFEKLATSKKKLTPDMFIECPDFKVVFEVKR